jgi:hypothetical protein
MGEGPLICFRVVIEKGEMGRYRIDHHLSRAPFHREAFA